MSLTRFRCPQGPDFRPTPTPEMGGLIFEGDFKRKNGKIPPVFRSFPASGLRGPGPFSDCDTTRRAGRCCPDRGERHHPSAHGGDRRRSGIRFGRSPDRCVLATSGGRPSMSARVQKDRTSRHAWADAWRSGYRWSGVSFRCTSDVPFRPPQPGTKKDVNPLGCTSRELDYGKCSIWSKRSSGNCPVRNFSAMTQQAVRYLLFVVLRDMRSFSPIFSQESRCFPEIGWTRMRS